MLIALHPFVAWICLAMFSFFVVFWRLFLKKPKQPIDYLTVTLASLVFLVSVSCAVYFY